MGRNYLSLPWIPAPGIKVPFSALSNLYLLIHIKENGRRVWQIDEVPKQDIDLVILVIDAKVMPFGKAGVDKC